MTPTLKGRGYRWKQRSGLQVEAKVGATGGSKGRGYRWKQRSGLQVEAKVGATGGKARVSWTLLRFTEITAISIGADAPIYPVTKACSHGVLTSLIKSQM